MADNIQNIQYITSTQNNLVKYALKLQDTKTRKQERKILLDGKKTVFGLIQDDVEIEYIFLKEEYFNFLNSQNPEIISKIKNVKNVKNIVFVDEKVLKKISTTKSTPEIAGIIKEPEIDKNIFKNLNKIALLDGIKDAGNLGTIIRSAAAFSFDGIILFNDCVDIYNSKVIRATAQNMFKIPIIHISDINFIKELKKTHKIISTVVNSKNDITKYDFEDRFIIAFGSEAEGISKEIEGITDDFVTFFMDKKVESLNLAVFASIIFAFIKVKNS